MSEENVEKFTKSIWETIDFYRDDFGLTVCEAIGVLELIKLDLWDEQKEALKESED